MDVHHHRCGDSYSVSVCLWRTKQSSSAKKLYIMMLELTSNRRTIMSYRYLNDGLDLKLLKMLSLGAFKHLVGAFRVEKIFSHKIIAPIGWPCD